MATMLGPVGVSKANETASPLSAETAPTAMAARAIVSGVRVRGRAAAAGMISIAAINSAPTTLIATATVIARARVRTRFSRRGCPPDAVDKSGLERVATYPIQDTQVT